MQMYPERIGEQVKKRRKEKALTLQAISDLSGLSVSYLSQIENGSTTPSLKSLARIAKSLDVPIVSLFIDEKPRPGTVLRKGRRPTIHMPDTDIRYELLVPDLERQVEFLLFRIGEGKGQEKMITHEGE
jgi:transcriptional regulator with XRE-family HTH domain